MTALSRRCSSSAMILAMHHLQVACLAGTATPSALHSSPRWPTVSSCSPRPPPRWGWAASCARASARSATEPFRAGEAGGGHLLRVRRRRRPRHLSARPDAPASDQVLVLCPAGSLLEQTSEWDTLGSVAPAAPDSCCGPRAIWTGADRSVRRDRRADHAPGVPRAVGLRVVGRRRRRWPRPGSIVRAKPERTVDAARRAAPGRARGASSSSSGWCIHGGASTSARAKTQSWASHRFNTLKVAASRLVVEIVTRHGALRHGRLPGARRSAWAGSCGTPTVRR